MDQQRCSFPSLQYVTSAMKTMVVNVVYIRRRELHHCSEIFGIRLHYEKPGCYEDPLSLETGPELIQVMGCVGKLHQWQWIASSEPVKSHSMEVIMFNSSAAPLLLVVPMDEIVSMGGIPLPSWIEELRKLLIPIAVSKQPVILLGICNRNYEDRVLKHAVLNKLGIHTDYTFWLLDLSDCSVSASCYEEILGILSRSVSTSVSPFLQVEKLVITERCQGTEILPTIRLLSDSCATDIAQQPTAAMQHLQTAGLVMSSPFPCTCDSAMDQTEEGALSTVLKSEVMAASTNSSGTGEKDDDDFQLILQPKTFSDQVAKLMDMCRIAHAQENECLVPSAQHGLIPKQNISLVPGVSLRSVLPALHRAGIMLDPLLVVCEHADCAEEMFVLNRGINTREASRHNHLVDDARQCYLVPSCLREDSHLSTLAGYHGITPLAFRSPGCYQINIPLSLFHQLVAYLMKHFPSSVKCSKYAARFHIAPLHILEITSAETYITAVVYVHNKEQSLSSVTPGICARMRAKISTHLDTLSTAAGSLVIYPAALIQDSSSQWSDFVDLGDVDPLSVTNELYTIGGQIFMPHDDFFFWFGRPGPEPSEIQRRFCTSVDTIDPLRAAAWLYERQVICGSDLDQILSQDVDAQSQLLLRLLEGKGAKGLEALDAVLDDTTLKKKSKTLMVATATQTSPAVHGNVTQSGEENCEARDQIPWVRSEPQVQQPAQPLGAHQLRQSGSGGQVVPGALDPTNATDKSEQPWNRLSHSSDPAATISSPVSLPSSPVSLQDGQPVTTTSSSATYTGLWQQDLAFPLSQPTSPQPRITGAPYQYASETRLSVPSQKSVLNTKGDPEIHPIFESKYWHVERATDHFNEAPMKESGRRLGVGSFGTVFHGVLHSETGQKFEVAVKRLKKASSLNPAQVELSRKQFGTEMSLLTRYLHKNIVRLVGFSSDGPELCLIYEFMQRGALSHRLDCKDNSPALDWRVRLTIARDIGFALEFLHTAYRQPVIHCDVKSPNVLLGTNFEAKLSDFGLAKIGNAHGELQVETASQTSVGTRPYMAPEAFQGIVSTKIDVYSLGMILFELTTGLPPYSSKKKQDLKAYLEDLERQHVNMMKMLDPKARWPKGKGWEGRDNTFGLELLGVAKLATTRDHSTRPEIIEVLPRLKTLAERVEWK